MIQFMVMRKKGRKENDHTATRQKQRALRNETDRHSSPGYKTTKITDTNTETKFYYPARFTFHPKSNQQP